MQTPPKEQFRHSIQSYHLEEVGHVENMFDDLYQELHQRASQYMLNQKPAHTLQPTALVHEAWIRLQSGELRKNRDKKHFFIVATLIMKQILIEFARRKMAQKRGGNWQRVTMYSNLFLPDSREIDLLDLQDALEELRYEHERSANLIELRFFGGLSVREAAGVLKISESTASLDWRFARAWLEERLLDHRRDTDIYE